MKPPVFYGNVIEGKFTIDNKEQYDLWISSLEGDVKVELKVSKLTRSDRQRKYYWGVIVRELVPQLNLTEAEVNEWIKQHFNNRVINVNGKEVEIGMSIEGEKTDRVEEIYRNVRMWATEIGIYIAEPNEEDYY